MTKLPDSSFFSLVPFAKNGNISTFVDEDAKVRNGLGVAYSKSKDESGFKYLVRPDINWIVNRLNCFGINMMTGGLKGLLATDSTVRTGISGYPKEATVPYITSLAGVRQLAFMQPTSEPMTYAPSTIVKDGDPRWNKITPSFTDLGSSNFPTLEYKQYYSDLPTRTTTYNDSLMRKIYACREYDSNGRGMNKYGALFAWGWDATISMYRLYRIDRVFYGGCEIVEIRYGSVIVFCRYYNGTNCKVIEKTSGSNSQYLLRGNYRVTLVGGGGGGALYYYD